MEFCNSLYLIISVSAVIIAMNMASYTQCFIKHGYGLRFMDIAKWSTGSYPHPRLDNGTLAMSTGEFHRTHPDADDFFFVEFVGSEPPTVPPALECRPQMLQLYALLSPNAFEVMAKTGECDNTTIYTARIPNDATVYVRDFIWNYVPATFAFVSYNHGLNVASSETLSEYSEARLHKYPFLVHYVSEEFEKQHPDLVEMNRFMYPLSDTPEDMKIDFPMVYNRTTYFEFEL